MGELELGAAAEATIQAYKELANDPAKRITLSKDETCIQFLAYVIAEGSGTLIQASIDTLQVLSETSECRSYLSNTFGVLEALQEIADDARYTEELRDQAASLFTCLQFSKHINSNASNIRVCSSSSSDSSRVRFAPTRSNDTTENHFKGLSVLTQNSENASNEKSFLGPYNSKAKTITLQINGMVTQKDRQIVEEELIRVRGLISIVFSPTASRVTCRVKANVSVERLALAVAKTRFEAKLVITNSSGKETIQNIGYDSEKTNVTLNPVHENLPDYLPEEESPVRDPNSAMTSTENFRETASSFFSAAANLLQNTFYW